jgi:hypothetical protein
MRDRSTAPSLSFPSMFIPSIPCFFLMPFVLYRHSVFTVGVGICYENAWPLHRTTWSPQSTIFPMSCNGLMCACSCIWLLPRPGMYGGLYIYILSTLKMCRVQDKLWRPQDPISYNGCRFFPCRRSPARCPLHGGSRLWHLPRHPGDVLTRTLLGKHRQEGALQLAAHHCGRTDVRVLHVGRCNWPASHPGRLHILQGSWGS